MVPVPSIYLAALITSGLSLVVIGGLVFLRAPSAERRFLFLLVVVMLPMNALAFHGLRLPFDQWLVSYPNIPAAFLDMARLLYAPGFEEPAKLWPFLVPWIYRRVTSENMVRVAFAVGLGFGIGEAWTIAHFLAGSPHLAKVPLAMLGGYMSERFMVCLFHAAFTGTALHFIVRRKRPAVGVMLAMAFHFMANFPLFLAAKNVGSLGKETWSVLLLEWMLANLLVAGLALAYMEYGAGFWEKLLHGRVKCPECANIYRRPLFRFNLFHKSYEKCPCCQHWHLVSAFDYREPS
jgi:hypothetical protein